MSEWVLPDRFSRAKIRECWKKTEYDSKENDNSLFVAWNHAVSKTSDETLARFFLLTLLHCQRSLNDGTFRAGAPTVEFFAFHVSSVDVTGSSPWVVFLHDCVRHRLYVAQILLFPGTEEHHSGPCGCPHSSVWNDYFLCSSCLGRFKGKPRAAYDIPIVPRIAHLHHALVESDRLMGALQQFDQSLPNLFRMPTWNGLVPPRELEVLHLSGSASWAPWPLVNLRHLKVTCRGLADTAKKRVVATEIQGAVVTRRDPTIDVFTPAEPASNESPSECATEWQKQTLVPFVSKAREFHVKYSVPMASIEPEVKLDETHKLPRPVGWPTIQLVRQHRYHHHWLRATTILELVWWFEHSDAGKPEDGPLQFLYTEACQCLAWLMFHEWFELESHDESGACQPFCVTHIADTFPTDVSFVCRSGRKARLDTWFKWMQTCQSKLAEHHKSTKRWTIDMAAGVVRKHDRSIAMLKLDY